ncbi:DUF1638 domain-containing protein [Limibaculum sp. M0105]|uniref:DUF1638 domain-containing protein n=1 Tax=Thermohalobaculum xanthum TaxID=2753746 RepID=A0A8J7SBZ4_9RHOB|nr:DUF1638 domain-containing protein [Thermohalobaculum xanthum]MBK0397572.1 DUF1638 domain-containing protein [Thermohalobaculum xanthum]
MTSSLPDDDTLTETGLELRSRGRVLLIACGALAREILALTRLNGWSHIDLACLPAKLHNRPALIPEAVRGRIQRARKQGYTGIHVVYADCGTGGLLDRVCEEEGVSRIEGPHCYSFFDGNDAFAERSEDEVGAFYLTDFLARQFDALVWRGMGLDRHPELRDLYFGNYDRVVFLAQTEDPALETRARAAADRLGLAFEKRVTGYGDLAGFVSAAAQG